MSERSLLAAGLEVAELPANDTVLKQLSSYLDLLEQWNRRFNLTAVRDRPSMVTRHVLDSLVVAGFLRAPRLLDVGSGAGLPGIPLAICDPGRQFVLNDSNGKKTRFLTHVVNTLGLANVRVIHQRVETIDDRFEEIVCRAFAPLDRMSAQLADVLAPEGRVLAMKADMTSEPRPKTSDPLQVYRVHALAAAADGAPRCIVELRHGTC